jgi:hypothetical protein
MTHPLHKFSFHLFIHYATFLHFDVTGDIISGTLKTVLSRHKYGNTFPKNPVICHTIQGEAIVFQEREFETKSLKKCVSPFGNVGPPKYQ